MTLGECVKNYRTTHKLTQQAFARLCDVSTSYIGFIELGSHPRTKKPFVPSSDILYKLASTMGMTLEELVQKVDDIPSETTPSSSVMLKKQFLEITQELTEDELSELCAYGEFILKQRDRRKILDKQASDNSDDNT